MIRIINFVLMVTLFAGCSKAPDAWPRNTFNSTSWVQANESERYVFAHDLIDRQILKGKTVEEVKLLLGPPSSEYQKDHSLTYVLQTGGDGFDQVYILDIRFKPSDETFEKALIRGD